MVDLPQCHLLDQSCPVELGLQQNYEPTEMFQVHHLDKLAGGFPSQHWSYMSCIWNITNQTLTNTQHKLNKEFTNVLLARAQWQFIVWPKSQQRRIFTNMRYWLSCQIVLTGNFITDYSKMATQTYVTAYEVTPSCLLVYKISCTTASEVHRWTLKQLHTLLCSRGHQWWKGYSTIFFPIKPPPKMMMISKIKGCTSCRLTMD